MTMMRHRELRLGADEGFSFVEVMIVTMMLGMILAAAYMAVGMVSTVTDGIIARGSAQDSGQLALEKMSREVRQAQTVTDAGTGKTWRMAAASATSISFWADIDHNGILERVTYTLTGGQLTRTTASATKTYPSPSDFGVDTSATVLTQVDPALTTMFVLKNSSNATTTDISDSPVTAVTAVQMAMRSVVKSGAQTATVDFPPDLVQVRSFGPGIVPWN